MKHHRYPWQAQEIDYVIDAKARRVSHKIIARHLERSPRAVDQQVARMKEMGLLAMHRREEIDLLAMVEAESRKPEWYPS